METYFVVRATPCPPLSAAFGAPCSIKLVKGTVEADSPESAQAKASVLYPCRPDQTLELHAMSELDEIEFEEMMEELQASKEDE